MGADADIGLLPKGDPPNPSTGALPLQQQSIDRSRSCARRQQESTLLMDH